MKAAALHLGRRGIGEIVGDALTIFTEHFPTFFTATFVVVGPWTVLIRLLERRGGGGFGGAAVLLALVGFLVVPALVTALHVQSLQRLARGEELHWTTALRDGLARFGGAIGPILLAGILTVIGFVLLIVPGIYLMIAFTFVAQVAVVEHPSEHPLQRSRELVRGQWGHVLLVVIVLGIVGQGLAAGLDAAADAAIGPDLPYALIAAVLAAIGTSVTALGTSLLFFDARTRHQEAPAT